jgi:hypothetical protein
MSINTSNRLLLSEILKKVSNAKTKTEKIAVLQEYDGPALRAVLIWNYDETVVSLILEGEVPYTPNAAPAGTEHTILEKEYTKLYYFVKGGDANLKQFKREQMFIQLLEGLHSSEAELLCLVKDGLLQKQYRITKAVVEEAFPQIKWGNRGG